MDIQARKLSLIQKLMNVSNESLLEKVNKILDKEMVVAYTVEGKPLTQQAYNKRLEEGERQILSGDSISQEDLEGESEDW